MIRIAHAFLYSFIAFLFAVCWYFQSVMPANVDAAWLIEASKRLLAGGGYTKNFFENNPPWILYFYSPIVILHHSVHLSLLFGLRLYGLMLGLISFGFCFFFSNKLFPEKSSVIKHVFLLVLPFLFFILPYNQYMQRENLLVILSMPYLLLMACRIEKISLNSHVAIVVGLLAGSGFIMKPYFLMTLFLLELYSVYKSKRIAAFVRPETVSILLLLIGYIGLVVIRHSDYLLSVVPIAMRSYVSFNNLPWAAVLFTDPSLYCLSAMLSYALLAKKQYFKKLMQVLFLALIGFYGSYLIQHNDFYYHILPALTIAILLFLFILWNVLYGAKTLKNLFSVFVLLILMFPFFLSYSQILQSVAIFQPFYFIGLLLCPLVFLFRFRRGFPYFGYRTIVAFLLLVCLYFVGFYVHTFIEWKLFFTFLLLSIAFYVSALPGTLQDRCYYFLCILLGLFFFIYLLDGISVTQKQLQYKSKYEDIVKFLDANANHQSVYFFANDIKPIYPNLLEAKNTENASRFSYFWLLAGIERQMEYGSHNPIAASDRELVYNMIADDIQNNKPKFIFVDTQNNNKILCHPQIDKKDFTFQLNCKYYDYLKFLMQNKNFQSAWNAYHYMKTIDVSYPYQFHLQDLHYRLEYQHVPADSEIDKSHITLYLTGDKSLKYAFRLLNDEIKRVTISASDKILTEDEISAIKQSFSQQGLKLSRTIQWNLDLYILKHQEPVEMMKFEIYERVPDKSGRSS